MPDILINIAQPADPKRPDGRSTAGHVWITKPDGSTTGFAPGGVTNCDDYSYKPGYISVRVPITDEQNAILNNFKPDEAGFGANDYNVFDNSCIDYIWALLFHIGLNPSNHQGALFPQNNVLPFLLLPGAEFVIPRISPEISDEHLKSCTPLPPAIPTPPLDPLALDLNGDGIVSTLSQENGVYFDLDNSGFAEKSGWLAPEDGFLVLDRNNNNQIDGGNELFGTETMLETGQKATNGFEALKEFDQNGDSKIDNSDSVYQDLKIWQDKNSNGLTDDGEIFTLEELSIASIGLNYKNKKYTDSNGTLHQQNGLFIRDDGSSGVTNTLFFENDLRDSVAVDNSIVVSDDIKALPNAKGFGNLHDLHQAMALDESGYLRSLVEAFVQESDAARRSALTYQILVYWTGQQNTDPAARGNYINGQHLAILETFWGQTVSQQKPTQAYAKQLNEIFTGLELSLYAQLRAGSDLHTKNLLNISVIGQENNALLTDFTAASYYFIGSFIYDSAQAAIEFKDFTQVLNGLSAWDGKILTQFLTNIEEATAGDEALLYTMMNALHSEAETIVGTGADDIIRGYNGDDTLDGGKGNDVLEGGNGNDKLYGGSGNDTLYGGTGNDVLEGGYGSDTYLFDAGDGHDVISESTSNIGDVDTLRLGEGLNPQDVVLERKVSGGFYANDSLVITFSDNSTDSITLYNYFGAEKYQVEQIVFADGTVWDVETVKAMVLTGTDEAQTLRAYAEGSEIHAGGGNDTLYGAAGDDVLYGDGGDDILQSGSGNDALYGGEGNDVLESGNGNDLLSGGTGNDSLKGGAGSDTYIFNVGDGQDVITEGTSNSGDVDTLQLGEGLNPQDVVLQRKVTGGFYPNDSLVITFGDNSTDSITLYNYFGSEKYQVEQIVFADGTVWDVETVKAMVLTGTDEAQTLRAYAEGSEIHAGGGNDTLYGAAGDDVLHGGEGDDILVGNNGHDVLEGGSGNDKLYGSSGNDILHGGAGNDALEGGYGSDTYLFNVGDGQDSIYENYNNSGDVDVLRFGEGIRPEDIRLSRTSGTWSNLILSVAGTNDSVTIKDFFANSKYQVAQITFADGTVWDVETVKVMLLTGTDEAQTLWAYDEGNEIHAGGGNDTLYGAAGDDVLYGGEGNDILVGNNGHDVLEGGSGDDKLYGSSGNDTLHGGTGNDALEGGYGSDTYLFNVGDGQDSIYENYTSSGDVDVLRFGEGIRPEDIRLSRTSGTWSNLILSVAGTDDSVTIKDFFANSKYQVAQITFADGTVWDVETVKAMLLTGTDEAQTLWAYDEGNEIHAGGGNDTLYGAAVDDVLYGDEGNDVLDGGSGNDVLSGGSGNDSLSGGTWNDILHGGTGNDKLAGGTGSDTYLFNVGDGQDVITEGTSNSGNVDVLRFGEGIRPEDISLIRTGGSLGNLLLSVAGTEDNVTIQYFFSNSKYQIEQVEFADGTVWEAEIIKAQLLEGTDNAQTLWAYTEGSEIHAGGGNDTLYGAAGDDVLYGDEGNDVLDGGSGNDVLSGGSGNDSLSGGTWNDILHGGTGNDKLAGGTGSDTYLFNVGDGQDVITEGTSNSGNVDTLQLGEGLTPQNVVLQRKVTTGLSGNDSLIITFGDNSADSITLYNYFGSAKYQIEHITFADGTDWLVEDILNYFEDDIPLPLAAPEDAPVSLSLVHEQIAQFTAGDGGDEDDAVVIPSLTTAKSSVSSLVAYA